MTDTDELFRATDLLPRKRRRVSADLPPGQCEISTFPRYGTHLATADPPVPDDPTIRIAGCDAPPLTTAALQALPRTKLVADFHCVAGWTARNLEWTGVRMRDLYDALPVPAGVTHLRFVGRDGFRAVLLLEDALGEDVLIADALDGAPIPPAHGGPVRLISASQYGYKSVKHLCRIEFHETEPSDAHPRRVMRALLRPIAPHPRARVWLEERNAHLPAWSVRRLYRTVIHPVPYVLGYLGYRRNAADSPRSASRTASR